MSESDRGSILIPGYAVSASGIDLPAGEQMVEVPMSLLVEALQSMDRS